MSLQYGAVADPAELAWVERTCSRAFGVPEPSAATEYYRRIGVENVRVLRDSDGPRATLALYRVGQWFGGVAVPCAAVAAVAVPPERRGDGIARALMTAFLREAREARTPLAALYASTLALYRSVGFEVAGDNVSYGAPPGGLGRPDRALPAWEADPADLALLGPLYRQWARRGSGQLDRDPALWTRIARGRHQEDRRCYVFGPPGAPEGYCVYGVEGGGDQQVVRVWDRVLLTPGAGRRFLTLLGDTRSLVTRASWIGPAVDPLISLLPERVWKVEVSEPWLLRVVDLPAAFGGRGYRADVREEVDIDARDDVIPENAGRWRIAATGGRATVERGGRGSLRLDARGAAALYSGRSTAADLALAGLLEGEAGAMAAADRVFAGPAPWMVDRF